MKQSRESLLATNRVVSRNDAQELDLASRIRLEKQLTDAESDEAIKRPLPARWSYSDYRNRSPWRRFLFTFLEPFEGRTVLDLGCGYNPTPIYLALAGADTVYACDVSPKAVAYTKHVADAVGVGGRVIAFVAAGEYLPLATGTIDIVHSEATLHHLDLALAGPEIARILRDGGKAAFKDPLGQNPLLEFARDYLPYQWKKAAKGTDHPLTFTKVEHFGTHFKVIRFRGFGLLSMIITAFMGRRESRIRSIFDTIDEHLLVRVPALQRYCRFLVTCVQKN